MNVTDSSGKAPTCFVRKIKKAGGPRRYLRLAESPQKLLRIKTIKIKRKENKKQLSTQQAISKIYPKRRKCAVHITKKSVEKIMSCLLRTKYFYNRTIHTIMAINIRLGDVLSMYIILCIIHTQKKRANTSKQYHKKN